MPIFENDGPIDNEDFLRQQLEFNKKVERLKKLNDEQREEDIKWMEEAYE